MGKVKKEAENENRKEPVPLSAQPTDEAGIGRSEGQDEEHEGCKGDYEAEKPGGLVGVDDECLEPGHDFSGSLALTAFSAVVLIVCGVMGGAGWLHFAVFIGGYLIAVGVTIVAARLFGRGDAGGAGIAFTEVRLTLFIVGFGGVVFASPAVLEVGAAAVSFGGLVGGISNGPVLVVVSRERRCSLLRVFWTVIRQRAPEAKP